MIRASIHQPMYLPYPGFFNKIKIVDVFIFLDDAEYSSGYFYNRNRIKGPNGELMITVPVNKKNKVKLNEITIAQNIHWQEKHMKSLIMNYGKSDYFENYRDFFEEIYSKKWEKLHELNMKTIGYLMEELDITIPSYFSSELLHNNPETQGTQRLIDICKEVDAEIYLSGISGKKYLDKKLFELNGIELKFQEYNPKIYKQLFGTFISNLSVIDLLFNEGERAKDFI